MHLRLKSIVGEDVYSSNYIVFSGNWEVKIHEKKLGTTARQGIKCDYCIYVPLEQSHK